jgi:hypothetical protein
LEQARSQRIEHTPRNVDVSDCVAIEENVAVLEVIKKGKQGNENGEASDAGRVAVGSWN